MAYFINPIRFSFTSGELNPWLNSRMDIELFSKGASRLENFFSMPFGGLSRRPGFQYIERAPDSSDIKLVPFQYSMTVSYLLEISPGKLRFYKNGSLLKKVNGTPYYLSTPWTKIESLRFQQINNVLYISSCDYAPMVLVRLNDLDWSLNTITWKNIPWRYADYNPNTITFARDRFNNEEAPLYYLIYLKNEELYYKLTPNVVYPLRISVSLPEITRWCPGEETRQYWTSRAAWANLSGQSYQRGQVIKFSDTLSGMEIFYTCVFDYDHTTQYQNGPNPINYPMFFSRGSLPLDDPLNVRAGWEFRSSGTWTAEWLIQKSYDNGATWITHRSVFSKNDNNFIINGDESDDPCLMRVVLAGHKGGQEISAVSLKAHASKKEYIFDAKRGSTVNTMMGVIRVPDKTLYYGQTNDWSLSAFNDVYGFPKLVGWHQNRLVFAGTKDQPQTVWLSRVDDYYNFKLGDKATDALELTMTASDQNEIQWIQSEQRMFIGTSGGEWILDTSDGKALMASVARFSQHSYQGSENLPIIPVESSLLFVQRGGKKLRELSYRFENDGYTSSDLTVFADHITHEGIREFCLQNTYAPVVWCILQSGNLVSMTWLPSQQILAWNRHFCGGGAKVLSVARIYSGKQTQELWAVLERESGAEKIRTVECLQDMPILLPAGERTTLADFPVYLDCFREVTASNGYLEGLTLYAGKAVTAYCKESPTYVLNEVLVSQEGRLELPDDAPQGIWIVGFPFSSMATSLPLDQIESFGKWKAAPYAKVQLLHSSPDFEFSYLPQDTWYPSLGSITESFACTDLPESPNVMTSGFVQLSQMPDIRRTHHFSFRTNSHYPLNLLFFSPAISVLDEM